MCVCGGGVVGLDFGDTHATKVSVSKQTPKESPHDFVLFYLFTWDVLDPLFISLFFFFHSFLLSKSLDWITLD